MSDQRPAELQQLSAENRELRARLLEAEETLSAIRSNEVDGIVVGGEHVFTRRGADEAYRVLVEEMCQGAATIADDGTILYCNRYFAQLLHSPLEQTIGASIYAYAVPAEEPALRAILWEVLAGGGVRRQMRLRTVQGREVPVLIAATVLELEGMRNVCIVLTDLSEHEALLHAEAASRAKDHFLAVLSHELRTPLTPVVMAAAALEQDRSLPAGVREDLTMIRRNIELETRLIDDLLDLSHVVSGKLRLTTEKVNANKLINGVLAILDSDIAAKSLRVSVRLEARCDEVMGDSARLNQVFWNLVKNAIKFTPEGGEIEVLTADAAGRWRLSVRDTGIGIDGDTMPRVFDPFEQGSSQVTRRFGGLGLGLAICKAVIDLHGGSISAHSEGSGRGALFNVELPIALAGFGDDRELSPPAGICDEGRLMQARVLVVEDHADTARMMARLLRSSSLEVMIASSVGDALRLASEHSFDLVISDLGLPDGTGHDLMTRLRQSHPGIPAIALSGYGRSEDLRKSQDAGFSAHLVKPISLTALMSALTAVLDGNAPPNGANGHLVPGISRPAHAPAERHSEPAPR